MHSAAWAWLSIFCGFAVISCLQDLFVQLSACDRHSWFGLCFVLLVPFCLSECSVSLHLSNLVQTCLLLLVVCFVGTILLEQLLGASALGKFGRNLLGFPGVLLWHHFAWAASRWVCTWKTWTKFAWFSWCFALAPFCLSNFSACLHLANLVQRCLALVTLTIATHLQCVAMRMYIYIYIYWCMIDIHMLHMYINMCIYKYVSKYFFIHTYIYIYIHPTYVYRGCMTSAWPKPWVAWPVHDQNPGVCGNLGCVILHLGEIPEWYDWSSTMLFVVIAMKWFAFRPGKKLSCIQMWKHRAGRCCFPLSPIRTFCLVDWKWCGKKKQM